jgi:hypothetical protein
VIKIEIFGSFGEQFCGKAAYYILRVQLLFGKVRWVVGVNKKSLKISNVDHKKIYNFRNSRILGLKHEISSFFGLECKHKITTNIEF